jgi:hypothetical protein
MWQSARNRQPRLSQCWKSARFWAALLLVGCTSTAGHQGADAPAGSTEAGQVDPSTPEAIAGQELTGTQTLGPGDGQETGAAAGQSLMPATPSDPSRSLPEVTVRNVGLHIGGQANDPASKQPFQQAVAAKFEDFLACYREVVEPQKGGTFGVDLFIRREGGHPDVRQPRTGMKGEAFKDCVVKVFRSVEFERPPYGPTVISYSIRFDVRDPSGTEP